MTVDSLWGDEFVLPTKEERTKKIIDKISEPKVLKAVSKEKVTKSKKISVDEKLAVIQEEVYRVLGKHKDDTVVIRDKGSFSLYIDKAIQKGRIAIDTETNNSLDPITCKLMGLCLFVDGQKQAYIPVNHIDRATQEKLADQVTESDIKEQLQRLKDNKVFVVMHNGKFDYQVIKCTCDICIAPDWDTLIGAKLLDENEKAGLKEQYVSKIDPDQEKYSIEHLFSNIDYAIVDPDLFALYAATDAMMTDKLYQYQEKEFSKTENKKVYELAKTLEMPLVEVMAEMELAGMEVDQEYANLLANKYNIRLKEIEDKIAEELDKLKPQIAAWKLTSEANARPKNKKGDGEGKSKVEQLEDPINMGSPTQLAILFYDILGCPAVSKKSPRGTGEKELEAIYEKLNQPICKLLIDRREIVKLITTYIETIPTIARKWPDGRARTHFNQYGADTGRLSSGGRIVFGLNDEWGGINFQNIPSSNREIRMLFMSKHKKEKIKVESNKIILNNISEVVTDSGKKYVDKLQLTDKLLLNNDDTQTTEYHSILDIQLNPLNNSESIISIS